MDQKQSFSLNSDFLGGFTSIFMKLVFVIIVVYFLVMIVNFLRDKFIHKEIIQKKDDISDLLVILNKLFFVSGFGFVIANIVQVILAKISNGHSRIPSMNLRGDWEYLSFGIIIIFIGIAFKIANKCIKS
jgi:hypothetical protein